MDCQYILLLVRRCKGPLKLSNIFIFIQSHQIIEIYYRSDVLIIFPYFDLYRNLSDRYHVQCLFVAYSYLIRIIYG